MNKRPLVSVVIPVYNVEAYLKRCVDSVLAQTYSNLDVVLVDDGAMDSSGAICDGYAERDVRIRVLHQDNGGLSAARNAGMKLVRGDYVVFVDSDDCIGPRHIEHLLSCALHYDTPFTVTGYMPVEEKSSLELKKTIQPSNQLIPLEKAMEYTVKLGSPFASHAWGKLYRADLFPLLHYPVGKAYEDQYVTYKVIYAAKDIGYEDANDYYYTIDRKDSISNKDLVRKVDFLEALREEYDFAQINCPYLIQSLETRYSEELVSVLSVLVKTDNSDKRILDTIYNELKTKRIKVLSGEISVSVSNKLKYALTLLGIHCYRFAIKASSLLRQ